MGEQRSKHLCEKH